MVRFGVIHAVVLLGTLTVVVGLARTVLRRLGRAGDGRLGVRVARRAVGALLLGLLFGIPLAVSMRARTVWVIDDGDAGALAYRRYALFGDGADAIRADGTTFAFRAPTTGNEVVVNATRAPIVVETVQYGGVAFGREPDRRVLEPASCLSVPYTVNEVGPPPAKVEGAVGSTSLRVYVHR
ncbi:MAG: hypothetical protein U1E39_19130 [Planctomycetota bacterium]